MGAVREKSSISLKDQMNGSDWDVKGLPASTPQQQSITEYAHIKTHNIINITPIILCMEYQQTIWFIYGFYAQQSQLQKGKTGEMLVLYFNQQMFVTQQTVMYATLHTIFNIDKI